MAAPELRLRKEISVRKLVVTAKKSAFRNEGKGHPHRRDLMSKPLKSKKAGVTDPISPGQPPGTSLDWIAGSVLLLAVFLTYQPVWYSGFIWDDFKLLLANPCVVGPLGLKQIWTTSAADICPLTMTTFWVEHALWGVKPLGYHLVNVLLHGACAVALWQVLRALRVPGAWLGAALWALHPMQVESVAWISELKNTQSGLFFLLSILFFVQWLRSRHSNQPAGNKWNYGWMLLFASVAMASKSSTVILPVVLGLSVWWVEGRWHWRNLASLAPVFLLSIAATAASLWTEGLQLAAVTDLQAARTWPERLVTAGAAVWFYVGKWLWPHPLVLIYPHRELDAGRWISYLPLLAVIIVLLIFWCKRESWARAWFFVFAYFLVALLPALGFVDNIIFHHSPVFDHFQYLAGMGLAALAGAALAVWAPFIAPRNRWLQPGLCAGLLLAFSWLSWQRTWAFESEATIWSDTLAKNPNSWAAYNNLGIALFRRGKVDEAIVQYHKALAINPRMADAYNGLALALFQKGKLDDAITQYHKALEISPQLALAHYNLGKALMKKGQVPEATAEFQKAMKINPFLADAHNDLGTVYLQKGQLDAAIEEYQVALVIDPKLALAHYNLGMAFSQKGQTEAALIQYQKAVALDPTDAEAHNNLGIAFAQKGDVDAAMDQFEKAVALLPSDAEAHDNLGNAFLQKGQTEAAIDQYQKALAIDPTDADVHNTLGLALGQQGKMEAAMAQFREAIRLRPNFPEALANLAKGKAVLHPAPVAK
jgi:tetratricopeptide (TPR) repeat protein